MLPAIVRSDAPDVLQLPEWCDFVLGIEDMKNAYRQCPVGSDGSLVLQYTMSIVYSFRNFICLWSRLYCKEEAIPMFRLCGLPELKPVHIAHPRAIKF